MRSNYKKKHNLYNTHNKYKTQSVEFKIRTKLKMSPKEMKNLGNQKVASVQKGKLEFSKAEITTGKGLAVPICEGEEIVSECILFTDFKDNYLKKKTCFYFAFNCPIIIKVVCNNKTNSSSHK